MTTRWPSAVSSLQKQHNAGLRLTIRSRSATRTRQYASRPEFNQDDVQRHEKAALVEIIGLRRIDPVNPPRSTIPPPLNLPDRGDKNLAFYYFKIGRAYGSFYWAGIKAVWFNYKATQVLRDRLKQDLAVGSKEGIAQSAWLDHLKRSEYQLLQRNNYDIGKLPLFGLLVALFGEWLPLLVPFIPSAVPGTCRIPKQLHGMRAKAEERRRVSFRQGISEPTTEQMSHVQSAEGWSMTRKDHATLMLQRLRDDQLIHLSSTLNNHNRLWDLVQLPPPSFLLRRGLSRRLAYITSDDMLLIRGGGAPRLTINELNMACEERGLDILGKRPEELRNSLSWWLARQKDDQGRGNAFLTMLFRRPTAWTAVTQKQTLPIQRQR